MNVVKGASGDVRGDLSAVGEGFLSIATSGVGRTTVHMMTVFRQGCIRAARRAGRFRPPRQPGCARRTAEGSCPHTNPCSTNSAAFFVLLEDEVVGHTGDVVADDARK